MHSIAFIGAGAMGEALIRGLIDARVYSPAQIVAFDPATDRLKALQQETGIATAPDAVTATESSQVVLIAVKPQLLAMAVAPLKAVVRPDQLVISIALGVSTDRLNTNFDAPVPCVRVMPNTPCMIGAGASVLCPGAHARTEHMVIAQKIFGALGLAIVVDERLFDAVTGLSGSGPAYVYLFIEAMADGAVKMGLPRDLALKLAAQTVLGAATMVLETGKHPGTLKDEVTSPGGSTIAAIHALEHGGLRGTVIDAVEAATLRARELS